MGLYDWRNRLIGDWPMLMADHDPVNTLTRNRGRGGAALDGIFGAGAALPTKLTPMRGYLFDGATDNINVGDQSALDFGATGSIMIAFRLLAVTPAGDWDVLVSKENFATGRNGYMLYFLGTTDVLRFEVTDAGGVDGVNSTVAIPSFIGSIRTVVGTWDGTTVRLYIDGVQNNSVAGTRVAAPSGYPYVIGGSNTPATRNPNMECYHQGAGSMVLTPLQIQDYHRDMLASIQRI